MTEPYRIRSPETWAQARDDYLAGLDAEAVCRRYDLGLSAFRRRARKYGWRRIDQDDPAPDDQDLAIYDDVSADDQVQMARLRFVQALDQGKPVEAARWRRLWHALRAENDAFDAEFFAGMSPVQIAAFRTRMEEDEESEDEALLLAAPAPAPIPVTVQTAALPRPEPAENVHNVHSTFSSAHFSADASAPLSRAERRRRDREARRRAEPQSLSASTTPPARPPDTTSPPAMA